MTVPAPRAPMCRVETDGMLDQASHNLLSKEESGESAA